MKNKFIWAGLVSIVIVGSIWVFRSSVENELVVTKNEVEAGEIVSKTGLHAHPKLEILVNGEQQPIPGNIGVGPQHATLPTYDGGMKMTAMHTHEADGTIHLEFPKLVTRDDIRLKNFFTIWGKDFMSFGKTVTMTVNSEENFELGDYQMADGDQIILNYSN